MRPYDYILLDADNTLFDFDRAEYLALKDTARGLLGLELTDEQVALYSEINRSYWRRFERGEVQRPDFLLDRFRDYLSLLGCTADIAVFNRTYMASLGSFGVLFPGAQAFVRHLTEAGLVTAVITNGASVTQHRRFDTSPIRPLLRDVFISEELGVQKPEAAYFDRVCAALGIADRRRAVVVGDTLSSDILGGINAGMDTIWYNPKNLPPRPDIIPTRRADTYEALEQLLL